MKPCYKDSERCRWSAPQRSPRSWQTSTCMVWTLTRQTRQP